MFLPSNILLFLSLLSGRAQASPSSGSSLTQNNYTSWPNGFPKQIATVRRRPGLTHKEYLHYHTTVHGAKAWNAPDDDAKPVAYIQDHAFDYAGGLNVSGALNPSFVGKDDITELYSKSATSLDTPSTYVQTVIGPDGANFNDFPAAFSMIAHETFTSPSKPCSRACQSSGVRAFYWISANSSNNNDNSFNNATFAAPIMGFLLNHTAGYICNASTHTAVPGYDSRPYYGGLGLPTVNTVLKFWLTDADAAVTAFRKAQGLLPAQKDGLGIEFGNSFVLFTKEVTIYDLKGSVPFNVARLEAALKAEGE